MPSSGKLDRFDDLVPRSVFVNPWQPDGSFRTDVDLVQQLLGTAVGTSQQAGIVAAAADIWAAEELRRAGFDPDEVWPRRTGPRVMPRDVRNFVSALPKQLREAVEQRFGTPGARRALPNEAKVLGRAYTKQADVVIASWPAGVEVLVSTKTMLSSYQKNLRNRFEEGYGDAKNLRGRHPLASMGFLYLAGADIPATSLDFAIDMLRKLTTEPDVYDCACLLVIDGAQGIDEPEVQERPVDDEPAALSVLPDLHGTRDDVEGASEDAKGGRGVVTVDLARVPPDLGPDQFFRTLIERALERMPVSVYPEVRARRAQATVLDN